MKGATLNDEGRPVTGGAKVHGATLKYDVERPLTEQVREAAMSGEVVLPPMPEMGRRLLALLEQEEVVNVYQVAETVGNDPAIAAAVLRMANSAYFGGLPPVSDLNQAIGRLGTRRVGSLAAMLFHKGHYVARKGTRKNLLEALWCHAVASAIAARHLAGHMGANLEESYLAGLLHDIGKLLTIEAVDYLSDSDEGRGSGPGTTGGSRAGTTGGSAPGPNTTITPAIENEVMLHVHADLGNLVLAQWRFPDAICRVALDHHRDPAVVDDPLVLRVQAANAISKKIGAHPVPQPGLNLEEEPALARLNLDGIDTGALLADLEDEMAKVQSLF